MNQFKIGDKLTKDDWGLSLQSFTIGEPEIKTNYIDLPVGDGSIDLTEALRGEVSYRDRAIEATFNILAPRAAWQPLMDQIKAYAHGRKLHIKVPDDAEHYFIGRVNVGPLIKGSASATFKIDITAEPYKYKNSPTFSTTIIGAMGTAAVTLVNGRRRVIPSLTTNNTTQIIKDGVSASVAPGTHILTNFILTEGNNTLTLNAVEGTIITITYQEATL